MFYCWLIILINPGSEHYKILRKKKQPESQLENNRFGDFLCCINRQVKTLVQASMPCFLSPNFSCIFHGNVETETICTATTGRLVDKLVMRKFAPPLPDNCDEILHCNRAFSSCHSSRISLMPVNHIGCVIACKAGVPIPTTKLFPHSCRMKIGREQKNRRRGKVWGCPHLPPPLIFLPSPQFLHSKNAEKPLHSYRNACYTG